MSKETKHTRNDDSAGHPLSNPIEHDSDVSKLADEQSATQTQNGSTEGHEGNSPQAPSGPDAKDPDPFDPARLRLGQDFASSVGVRKELLTVPVRKPSREWFVRVHPDESYRISTAVIELKEDRETYLVDPDLWPDLSTEATFGPRALFLSINRQGVLFLWQIKLPHSDGKIDEWSRTALEAATMAVDKWVKVWANMSLGAYEVFTATGDLPDPEWPDRSLRDLLGIAFKDRHITSLDHPVLRKLRGEV